MSRQRILASALGFSAAAFITLAVHEGYTDQAVIPIKGDVPTLGFGQTQGVKMGDTTTPIRALIRFKSEIDEYEGAIKRCANVPMQQAEYDLWVNMAYNIGPTRFCRDKQGNPSSIVKALNAGDYKGACDAILLYKYAGKNDCSVPNNKVCPGLWKRRLEAHATCLSLL
jgi:lysozyme